MKLLLLLVSAIIAVAIAGVVKRQVQPEPNYYFLPDGAELVVGQWKNTFKCENRIYGYYADVDNDCRIFHICIPYEDEEGNSVPSIYSFFCGNQTVFDQEHLICAHPQDALPCSEAQALYTVNENFGRTDLPIIRQ